MSEFKPSKRIGLMSAGNYNTMPAPAEVCDLQKFFDFYAHYSPDKIEFRQALINGTYTDIKIFWFFDRAFALQFRPGEYPICWRFGCKHKYVELTQAECREAGIEHAGLCYHVLHCSKCGAIKSYDSSG